ncbi:hypothetical protein KY366_04255 [Candidatus Woesearchaeota archaeon]|nr:hypothetical protein [Candidatus Woesearchaeota archaeon]
MTTKRLKNKDSQEDCIDVEFKSIYNALRNFKKLSEQEATVYIEIMKTKHITVKELAKILDDKKIKSTTTKPYSIIKNLMNANLLFCKDKNATNKVYCPIHPRDLTLDISEAVKDLDDELAIIESEEAKVFREIRENSETLETEYEITNAVSILIDKKYEINFYYNNISVDENHMIYKRLIKNFSLTPKKGNFSMVVATKKDEKLFPKIVILLLKKFDLDQKNDIVGIKIVDPEIFDCLQKGVVLT